MQNCTIHISNFNWSWRECASNQQHLYVNISLGTSSFSGSCSMGYTQPIYLKTVFSWYPSICLSVFLPCGFPTSCCLLHSFPLPLPSLASCPVTSWRERMCIHQQRAVDFVPFSQNCPCTNLRPLLYFTMYMVLFCVHPFYVVSGSLPGCLFPCLPAWALALACEWWRVGVKECLLFERRPSTSCTWCVLDSSAHVGPMLMGKYCWHNSLQHQLLRWTPSGLPKLKVCSFSFSESEEQSLQIGPK